MAPFTEIGRLEKDEGSGVAWIRIKRALSFGSKRVFQRRARDRHQMLWIGGEGWELA